jgi:hypothetical protein
MALSSSQRRTLRKKAADNLLEVEHLLRVAALGDAGDVRFLRELEREFEWPHKGKMIVPLGLWNDAVCCFLEDGYDGIVRLATAEKTRARYLEFCIAVLEELATRDSVDALVKIGGRVLRSPEEDLSLSLLVTNALNMVLSFDKAPGINAETTSTIRQFLHEMLRLDLDEDQRASVVCALRGVGNEESVLLIQQLPAFKDPYAGTKASAVRAIRKRLASEGSSVKRQDGGRRGKRT